MEKCKKVCFNNEESAEFYIAKLQKTSNRKLKPVRSYLCPKCLLWHLTSIEWAENKKLKMAERQIANLKAKVAHYEREIEIMKAKLEKRS